MGLIQPSAGGGGTPFPGFAGVGVIAAETVGATALAGVSLLAPRGDHRHELLGSSPQATQALTAAAAAGASGAPSRFDHVHGFTGLPMITGAVYEWDFAIDGGAVGSIPMRLVAGTAIPASAIFLPTIHDMLTLITGGVGTTLGLTVDTANDMGSQTPVSGYVQINTHLSVVPVSRGANGMTFGTTSGTFKTTAPRTPQLEVAVNPLTAGKMRSHFWYVVSP